MQFSFPFLLLFIYFRFFFLSLISPSAATVLAAAAALGRLSSILSFHLTVLYVLSVALYTATEIGAHCMICCLFGSLAVPLHYTYTIQQQPSIIGFPPPSQSNQTKQQQQQKQYRIM